MKKIIFYIEKYRLIILLIIIIIILLVLLVLNKDKYNYTNDIVVNESSNEEKIVSTIKVDIKGMVENSGVYEINDDSRVIDVIQLAGGLKNNANTEYLNLSKKLKDGDVIIVYSNEYIDSLKKENIIYVETPCECPDSINNACINDEVVNENITSKDTLISINNASKEELMTLPGIGESKAITIIKYREENNGFKVLEDIMNVSGIGEAAYSKIKDYIKL